MPLPPALAARLAKRGIISKERARQELDQQRSGGQEQQEEVFAEDYDGDDGHDAGKESRRAAGAQQHGRGEVEDKIKYMGYPGCPNKWNAYHECGLWCQNTWGAGKTSPDPDYLARFKRMMDKYGPLPEEWKEKYDPGTGRHYFWCTRTDRVSWLPPGHPQANPMESASRLREILTSQAAIGAVAAQSDEEDEDESDDEDEDDEEMDLDSDNSSDEERRRERRDRERRRSDRDDRHRRGRRGRGRGDDDRVDPMDPASYSDAPRGNWASGLEKASKS